MIEREQEIEQRVETRSQVIGHGAIAEALEGVDKPFLFFASGVANSFETDEVQYDRERDLLTSQDRDQHLVYFTSMCVFTEPARRYSQHKAEMEGIVRENFPHHSIVRVGNTDWGTNPHQLVPFFKEKLLSGEPFEVFDDYRHLLSKEEFQYWVNLLPEDRNVELVITGERMKISDIVEKVKGELGL